MCLVFINTLYCLILSMLIDCVWLFATPWTAAHQVSLSFTISWILPKFISIKLVMLSNHFSFCLQSFPTSGSFPMSQHFTSEYWPKYWNFSFNISPSSEYSELISFRIDWFDLLAVQGTVKTLLYPYLYPYLTLYTKIISTWIKELNVRAKINSF